MRANGNGRRIYALADYTVEARQGLVLRTHVALRRYARDEGGPYSSERSVALMIACELLKKILKRDTQAGASSFSTHSAADAPRRRSHGV